MDVCMYNVCDIQTCTHGGGEWPKEFCWQNPKKKLYFSKHVLCHGMLWKNTIYDSMIQKKKSCVMNDILIDVILSWDLIISMTKKINSKSFNDATCNYLKWLKIISLKMF